MSDRSTRHRTTPLVEPSQRPHHPEVARPQGTHHRRLPHDRQVTLRTLEEPHRSQHTPTPPTRLDREDRPETLARLPPQRRPPLRLRRRRPRRQRRPRPVALVGPKVTTRIVRPPRQKDHEPPRHHRREPRTRPLPRTHRIHQHQDPTPHQNRIRVPRPRTPHRPLTPRPRQPPTTPTRPKLTHTYSRRVTYGRHPGAGC